MTRRLPPRDSKGRFRKGGKRRSNPGGSAPGPAMRRVLDKLTDTWQMASELKVPASTLDALVGGRLAERRLVAYGDKPYREGGFARYEYRRV